jgi:dTDP-4-dehydrorhamnose 3,5-epimerase
MKFEPQEIPGCYVVETEPIFDDRGFFARAFGVDEFAAHGLVTEVFQINLARSERTGTTRGLHWQVEPYAEAKFVRCIAGRIFDVCVDIRPDSITAGRWVGVELSAENRRGIYIPPGGAHGYQTLEPGCELLYTTSVPYSPAAERGARYDDPAFAIDWPLTDDLILSEKDRNWPPFTF